MIIIFKVSYYNDNSVIVIFKENFATYELAENFIKTLGRNNFYQIQKFISPL